MKPIWSFLLLLFVTLETYCQVVSPKEVTIETTSILYFISGVFIAILPLIKVNTAPLFGENRRILSDLFHLLYLLFLLGLIPFAYKWGYALFLRYDLNYKVADMLPIIQIMCERWFAGAPVYELVPFWDGTEPIYLPAMWLPYLPFTYYGLDIRWGNMIALLLSLHFIFFCGKQSSFNFKLYLILLPLGLLFNGLFFQDFKLISLTEEPIVILYYLFLAYALAKNKPYLIGFALSLCLMSRFALAFWVLMYLVYVFIFQNKKDALKIGTVISVVALSLLVSTGAIWQLDVILGLPNIYINHLMDNEWKFNGFIKSKLGLLKFFSFESLSIVNRLFFTANLLIPTACFAFFWKFKNKINQPLFALCSLKLCLVFFYNFLIMPFLYLFYTNTFLSIAILSWYLKEDF